MLDTMAISANTYGRCDLNKYPVLFLDDWPEPPPACPEAEDKDEDQSMIEVKKWRLQILLASSKWGIPSLTFHDKYHKMFGHELDVQQLGYEHLSEMFNQMTDVFCIQEPDETTAVLFPDYPRDFILHDARIGYNFHGSKDDLDIFSDDDIPQKVADGFVPNSLADRASLERDEDFPPDVLLNAEPYDKVLPVTKAKIVGTVGLFQGSMVGAASPESFYIRLAKCSQEVIDLPEEITKYFDETKYSIDAYNIPKEFVYPGFPCLTFITKERVWERCLIVGRTSRGNHILVESVDFGGVYAVDPLYLYLIPRRFFSIPRQTLRVALPGLKPSNGTQIWPKKVGSRMRCFSFENYFLDFLLMEPKINEPKLNSPIPSDTSSFGSLPSSPTSGPDSRRKRRKANYTDPQFEAIVVDRNDDTLDIYLDEILALETYATFNKERVQDLDLVKEQLKIVLKQQPRPKNPFL